jgi:hypothetical protein
MLRTVGKKMKPLGGFGFLELHFSIDMLFLREKYLMNSQKIQCQFFAR